MTESRTAADVAAEIVGLIVSPDSPYAKSTEYFYDANLKDAERIIGRHTAELRAEIERLKQETLDLHKALCDEFEAANELKRAFVKYGATHLADCSIGVFGQGDRCSCGFETIRKQIQMEIPND